MAARSVAGGRRGAIGTVLALVVAVLVWWGQGADPSPDPSPETSADAQQNPPAGAEAVSGTDPVSGLAWVSVEELPAEAARTLESIERGGPYPYPEDDTVFGNREGILPDRERGYYREYTVDTPGLDHRGARRIVGGESGERYWTEDHYASFERIRRSQE